MLLYIVKSTFCLVLLLGFYHLILEKEKMHRFNRFYLIGSVLFSMLVPSFVITVAPTEIDPTLLGQHTLVENTNLTAAQEMDYSIYILGLYSLVSGILFFVFGRKVFQILQKIRRNKKVNYFKATVVLLKEQILPYTFLNYIFINKNEYQTDSLEQQILTHELTHVKQKHTLDVLFIELLQNLFWFNPIFRYYKKAIQLNHEFLADDAVINSHKNISEYQHLLLNKTAQNNNIYLASNFNYSLTKKRLLMMTTPSSKTKILLKKIAIIPLIAGFTFAFAQKVEAQEKKKKTIEVVEIQKEKNGLTKEGMKEYERLFNSAKESKMYKQRDVAKMIALYKQMSKKQQNSVTDIRKVVPPPPPISIKTKVAEKNSKNKKNKKKPKPVSIKVVEKLDKDELVEVLEEEKEVVEEHELRELKEKVEEEEEVEVIEIVEVEPIPNEKRKVIPPPPPLRKNATKKEIERYEKAYKNWKVKVKRIPPPPPPISTTDHIKKMAKEGATFKYNGKTIGYKRALSLVKNKKKLHISTIDKHSKKPTVHISDKPMVVEVEERN